MNEKILYDLANNLKSNPANAIQYIEEFPYELDLYNLQKLYKILKGIEV